MVRDFARIAGSLPIRFTPDLAIEVDAAAAGRALTPDEAFALADHLTHTAVHKKHRDRQANAAKPLNEPRAKAWA